MTTVLEMILAHARTSPMSPAAKDATQELDFGELERQTRQIAAGLAAFGVGQGDRVAIHLPNSVEFLTTALGCMWVGAIFVPLSIADPHRRLATVIEDCDPAIVVARPPGQPAPVPGAPYGDRTVASPDTLASRGHGRAVPEQARSGPVYCIYTSGTTGHPKGVVIGEQAFEAAASSAARLLGFDRATRALCVSPFHFDGSFGTLFPVPAAGGSLVIAHQDSLMLPRVFFRLAEEEHVTHTSFSPSYLRLLLRSGQIGRLSRSSLRTLALGGEACLASDLAALWEEVPRLAVFNRYGPTETAIAVTTAPVSQDLLSSKSPIPIGRPHRGVSFRVLSEAGALVDHAGQIGELYIGGRQLMDGYWRDSERSAEVLRSDIVPGETLYRTGDLVYRTEGGDYVFVDRADRVLKRSGVRISLSEITLALCELPLVTAAACVPFERNGRLGIAAFVVPRGASASSEVRHELSDLLPASMLPDVIVLVQRLPITVSNKVDERALLRDAGLGELADGTSEAPEMSENRPL